MRKPTDASQVVRRKQEKSHSPLATLLTEVPDFVERSPFRVAATARPRAGEREVNNLHACRPEFSQTDNNDVTAPKDRQGKVGGQPRSIPELEKDIPAQIEDDLRKRMSIKMERALRC